MRRTSRMGRRLILCVTKMVSIVNKHWVLWDAECGFCRRSVDWLLARDGRGVLIAVGYQEAPSPPMTPELRSACGEAVHVVTCSGRVLRGGRAVLFLLGEIGWVRTARFLSLPPMVWAVEVGYRLVARNRQMLFFLADRTEG